MYTDILIFKEIVSIFHLFSFILIYSHKVQCN